jgi:hypothetical protein
MKCWHRRQEKGPEMLSTQSLELSEAEVYFLGDLTQKAFETSSALMLYLGQTCRQGCLVREFIADSFTKRIALQRAPLTREEPAMVISGSSYVELVSCQGPMIPAYS